MRNWNQYLKLWQQKRNELPIESDQQADWADMHQLLDVQMPVSSAVVGTQLLFKTALLHIAKFKFLYTLATLFAAGTITYFMLRPTEAIKDNKVNRAEIKRDNINNGTNAALNNSSVQDSLLSNKEALPNTTNTKATVDINNTATGVPANSTADKTNRSAAINITAVSTNNNSKASPGNKNGVTTGNNINGGPSAGNTANNKTGNAGRSGFNNKTILSLNDIANSHSGAAGNTIGGLTTSRHNNGRYSNNNARLNNHVISLNKDDVLGGTRRTRLSGPVGGGPATGFLSYVQQGVAVDIIQPRPPQSIFNWNTNALLAKNYAASIVVQKTLIGRAANTREPASKVKTKDRSGMTLPINWGILGGVNTPGSFTAANQKNTNGVPFDVYGGLFATYVLNNKWGINLQTKIPNPHPVSGNYSHTEEGKVDTSNIAETVNSKITDSRKMYTADVALHLMYNVTPDIGLKIGPVLTLPLKQANGISSVITSGTPKDPAAYYSKLTDAINGTNIEKKIRYGISGGVSFTYNRFLLDANYYHSFQTQKVSSDLGGYTSNTNSLQLSIGFRLNKIKK